MRSVVASQDLTMHDFQVNVTCAKGSSSECYAHVPQGSDMCAALVEVLAAHHQQHFVLKKKRGSLRIGRSADVADVARGKEADM